MTARDQDRIFEQWMEAHQGILHKVARSYSEQPAEQEDLLQEIRLAVWRSIRHFDGRSKPSSYIYRVALNRAISARRRTRSHRDKLDRYQHLMESTHPISAEKDDRLELVYAAIRTLNEADRSLILLHLEGFTYEEMAETLRLSTSNVGVRLSRIKTHLTQLMKGTAS